jgi:hypothetical protein
LELTGNFFESYRKNNPADGTKRGLQQWDFVLPNSESFSSEGQRFSQSLSSLFEEKSDDKVKMSLF